MPDELDALRHFRDDTPGPSTDAWTRARAAIAAAKSGEEPVRRRRTWVPGRRSRDRGPGRSRVLWIAAGTAVAAAVAALLAVLLPGSPAARGTGARVDTTVFVTRVERALSQSGQRNLVGYARTVYPPGFGVEPIAPGALQVSASAGVGSPWNVSYLVRWSYQGASKISAVSPAGHRVFDLGMTTAGGTLTSTGVFYRSGTWWRGATGPVPAGNGPARARCGASVLLGSGGWPAFIRHQLSCGGYAKGGHQRIAGIDATGLTGIGGRETFWVNPRTYLPVRVVFTSPSGARVQTDFSWLTPTRARLAQLRVPIPHGFRRVPPP